MLIERGSEVGGGDERTSVGTVARIAEAAEAPDGRWALGTVGTRRIRVREWLADDPFPRADVEDWPDPQLAPPDEEALVAAMGQLVPRLRRVLAAASELGMRAVPATVELADDPVLGSYQAVAVAPIGPADQQRLLEVGGAAERVSRLEALLIEEEQYLARRLALEGAGDDDGSPFGPG